MIEVAGGAASVLGAVAMLVLAVAGGVKTAGPELRKWVKLLDERRGR